MFNFTYLNSSTAGDTKSGSKSDCKNLNDSSNSGHSDDDSSDEEGGSTSRGSEPILSHHRPLSSAASIASSIPSSSAMYHGLHNTLKFNPNFGHMSHHQAFGDVSSGLVMHGSAEAMLQLSAASAGGIDYSAMGALGSLSAHPPPPV